jgi:DUF438 domain-containing protein
MAGTVDKAKVSRVAEFLRRIDRGENVRLLTKNACRIAEYISPVELVAAERSLLDEGYAPTLVNHLSTAFLLMRRYGQQLSGRRHESQDGHILQRVSAEHAVFRCLAAEMSEVAASLRAAECLSDTATEYRRLAHVVSHLHAMKEHFEREDDVILPYLRRVGWTGLCAVAANDHAQLRAQIDCLTSLVTETQTLSPEDLKAALVDCVVRFCSYLLEHLSLEDGLLWPIALVVIDDPAIWKGVKTVCEEIGYCGVHVT